MAQRRERPPVQRSGQTFDLRLPDGRTVSMPVGSAQGSAASDVCCFCGVEVVPSAPEGVSVEVRWPSESGERGQTWSAHRGCLLERMHDRVKGQGPFFGKE